MVLITSCPLWFLSLATPLHLTSNSAETQSHAHVQERCVKEPISQREKEAQPEEGLVMSEHVNCCCGLDLPNKTPEPYCCLTWWPSSM